MGIEGAFGAFGVGLNVLGKPFGKFIMRVEDGWHDEMQQSP